MGKLIYSQNIGFPMQDWAYESVRKVYAGTNCIMAITDDGRVLQKVRDPDCAARTQYWTRIRQIAISKWCAGAAIGLVSDGTCMISKRPIRSACEYARQDFDEINAAVKSWHDIVQVAASDALFALDASGCVHYAYYSHRTQYEDDYREVTRWENVCRIVTGTQNAVFGVTRDGRVLCAGANCKRSHLKSDLEQITDAVAVYPTGSECETIVIGKKDGTLIDDRGVVLPESSGEGAGPAPVLSIPEGPLDQVLEGSFFYTVVGKTPAGRLFPVINRGGLDWKSLGLRLLLGGRISSFAVGDVNYGPPFLIAVAETDCTG